MRQEWMLGVVMLVAGLAIAGMAAMQIGSETVMHAQASPPASTLPAQDEKPAETRPTTPAPEPARPQPTPDATPNSPPATGGAATGTPPPAALPSAPAEKIGEPLKK